MNKPSTDIKKLILIESIRKSYDSFILQEVGEQPPAPAAPAPAAPAAPGAPPADDPTALLNQVDDPNAAAPQGIEYTTEQFVEDLNKIRGGRSFDDQDVYQQIDTMFQGVDPTSKETIKNILQQLSAIVTPPANAQDVPATVDNSGQQMNTQSPGGAPPAPAAPAPAAPVADMPPA